ncbi:MAG: lipid II flippase MurJ [Candidatus Thiodiazotropha sp.]
MLLIVWGLADNDALLSVPLLVGVFLSTLSSVISSFVVAILNVQNHYVLPGLLWGLRIIPLLVFWKLSPNVIYLPWLMAGIGLSDILRARCLYSKVKLDGVLSVDWREVFRGYAAVAIGSIVVGMNPIVDRLIAGLGQPGDLSILELGERIFGIVGSLSTIGIMSVLLVEFSDRVKLGDLSRYFQKILVVFLGWSCLWLLFIYSFWYLLEGRIFAFLKLTDLQYQLVTLIFFNYLGGLPAFIVGLVCVRGFLSIGKAEVIAVLAVVSLGVNALLSYVLNSLLGVSGIALATSIVTTVITITMIILLSNSRYV